MNSLPQGRRMQKDGFAAGALIMSDTSA